MVTATSSKPVDDTASVEAAPRPLGSSFRRLVTFVTALVVAPTGAFERLSRASNWIIPLAAVAVLAAVIHMASVPFTVALVKRLAASTSDEALGGLERWLLGIALVRGGWVALKAVFVCWVLWLTLSLKGESVAVRRLMVIASYASVAFVAEDALRFVVSWLRGIEQIRGPQDLQSYTGIDAFISTQNMGIIGKLLLAQISLFSLWFVTILRGGLIGLGGIRPRSATVTAMICWAYLLALQLGMAFVVNSLPGPGAAANP